MNAQPTRSGSSTREALLDAAEQLFSERGFARVGIREIAEAAQANIASIKYHFGSKLELYLETVRRAMQQRQTARAWDAISEAAVDPAAAAAQLARFIRRFLERILTEPDDCATCLMLREATQPSEAVDAVVRDFVKPHQTLLVDLIGVLRPDVPEEERPFLAHSVLAQIIHYSVFRPFLVRLHPSLYESRERIDALVEHVVRFSLTGLGCDAELIEAAAEQSSDGEESAGGNGE